MLVFENIELGRVLCIDSRCEQHEVGLDQPIDVLVVPETLEELC